MVTCPNCKREYEPVLIARDPMGFRRHQLGDIAQEAFPGATAAEREQLISGICSDTCWDEFLGPDPDGPNAGIRNRTPGRKSISQREFDERIEAAEGPVDRFGDPVPEGRVSFPNETQQCLVGLDELSEREVEREELEGRPGCVPGKNE